MAVSIINSNSNKNDIELTPHDSRFISEIHDELTMYGELPYSIPQRQIIAHIKTSARYFYNNAPYAVAHSFFLLRASDIKQHVKKANNGVSDLNGVFVQLPHQIRVVKSLNFLNKGEYGGDFERSFDLQNMGMQTGLGGVSPSRNVGLMGYGGIDKDLYLLENVVKMVENRAIKSMIGKTIPFKFNPDTHTLLIQGNITKDIGLEVKCDIPIYNLYNDDLFRRYVTALCHQSLRRKIGGIAIELPSGATLSADELCNKYEDDKNVEEILKGSSGLGALIIKVK